MIRLNRKILIIIIFLLAIVLLSLLLFPQKNHEYFSNDVELVNWWITGDSKSKSIFEELFNKKKDNVKVYSVFGEPNFNKENDTIYVQYSGESDYKDSSLFDINFIPTDKLDKNVIIFPHAYYHILFNNLDINKLVTQRKLNNKERKFCLFAVSNGGAKQRNEFFSALSKYKKVDSCGKFMNNMGESCPDNHDSNSFHEYISNYKFMICFENTSKPNYFTEKLINAYYNDTIPIYWGCPNIGDYVDMKSILYLSPDYTNDELNGLIDKIKYLDANDKAYKDMFERSFFKNGRIPDEFDIKKIKNKIYDVLGNQ
jgi:hypothetical protein